MSLLKIYLFLFNLASAAGWFYVWYLSVCHLYYHKDSLQNSSTYTSLYNTVHDPLFLTQSLALMEVIHSIFGLVRSPVMSAFMQVSSRLLLVWGILHYSPESRTQFGFGLMVLSWATTEIPRYLFYSINVLNSSSVPSILTWLRYSTFLILYPTGITGELLCIWNSLPFFKKHPDVLSVYMPNRLNFELTYTGFLYFILALYVPGSWFMYTYMMTQRKKALSGNKDQSAKKTQ